jgi:hypothetical protein
VSEELDQLEADMGEMGPVDYVVMAWPGGIPPAEGKVAGMIADLSDRGIVRVLDFAVIAKDADGNVAALDLAELGPDHHLSQFDGASSGMMDIGDLEEAAANLDPDSAAAVLVWENRWAAPIAVELRKTGGLLIDSGRIPVQGILAALDALEAAEATN